MHSFTKFFLAWSWCLWLPIAVGAQDRVLDFQHFNVGDGLPHRDVKTAFIDQHGICWAATAFALSRWDGSDCLVYNRENLGNAVEKISLIHQGIGNELWLWGRNGLHLFYPYEERVVRGQDTLRISSQGFEDQWFANSPKRVLTTSGGKMVFNPSGEAVIIQIEAGQVTHRRLPFDTKFDLLGIANNGNYWAQLGQDIIQVDTAGKVQGRWEHPGLKAASPRLLLDSSIIYYAGQNIGIKHPFGLFHLHPREGIIDLTTQWGLDSLRRVYVEPKDTIFWCELDGAWELRGLNGDLRSSITPNSNEAFIRAARDSWMATNGATGNLWIAGENGLTRVSSQPSPFQNWLHKSLPTLYGDNLSVRGIHVEGDHLFTSAELDGLIEIEGAGATPRRLATEYFNYAARRGLPATYQFPLPSDFRGLFSDSKGDLWIGHQRVVLRREKDSGQITPYPAAFEFTMDWGLAPWSFAEDSTGTIWVGTQRGVGLIPPGADSVYRLQPPPEYASILSAIVYKIGIDEKGHFWLGTNQGLYELDQNRQFVGHFWSGGNGRFSLPYEHLYHFHFAEQGKIWLATNGDGLLLFDPTDGQYRQWTKRQGLSDNRLYAVYTDPLGVLWMPSDFGLMRFDTTTNIINTFLPADGLPHHEFNRASHFQTADGRLFFGTINGIAELDPLNFKDWQNDPLPPIRISHFSKGNNGPLLTAPLIRDSLITVRPADNYFTLKFSLLDYQKERPTYSYRLGTQEQWTPLSGNTLRLAHLEYGSYFLEVKARLPNGRETQTNLKLNVRVIRPLFQQPWFLGLLFIGFCGLGYLVYYLRTQHLISLQIELEQKVQEATFQIRKDKAIIEQQAADLKQLDEVKTRFFANVSHELRTPLTLILGPLQSLLKTSNLSGRNQQFLSLAEQNGRELLQMVNAILDLAKLEAKGLPFHPSPANLNQLIQRSVNNFSTRAELQSIQLKYNYVGQSNRYFEIDSAKVATIINNLLSNALRFTPTQGEISVTVIEEPEKLRLAVQDTGAGISAEDLPFIFDRFYQAKHQSSSTGGSGIGLALCKEFSHLMGGQLSVESSPGEGTLFTLLLPKKLASPPPDETRESRPATVGDYLIVPTSTVLNKHPNHGNKSKILIVEDNVHMRMYLQSILGSSFIIRTAVNGKEGLNSLIAKRNDLPDLILTDLMMPVMDGTTMIQQIKAESQLRLIPIIVLSARSTVTDRLQVLRHGVDDFLAKPFEEEELLTRIKRLLENHRERMAAAQSAGTREDHPFKDVEGKNGDSEPSSWLTEVETFVIEHLRDDRLSATFLAHEVHLSPRQLQRRMLKEVGMPTGKYIQEVRLNEALKMLEQGQVGSVKALAYHVGFKHADYFSSRFQNRFGKVPSSYL